jgi:hypothetical protein
MIISKSLEKLEYIKLLHYILTRMDQFRAHARWPVHVCHDMYKKPLDRFGEVIGAEVKHELGHTLKEEHVKEYVAAVQKNMTHNNMPQPAAPPTPSPQSIPVVPKVDPTKAPGYCGPCYGCDMRPGQCCNTCDEVRDCYRARGWALASLNTIEQCLSTGQTQDTLLAELDRGDGCQMYGYLEVTNGNTHESKRHREASNECGVAFTAEQSIDGPRRAPLLIISSSS